MRPLPHPPEAEEHADSIEVLRGWIVKGEFSNPIPLSFGRQGILFRLDGTLPRFFHPSGLSRVEFNVRLKLRRNVSPGVDGVHRTFIHASHAIYALLRVNDKLTLQLIKAGHRAHHHAVGELAPHTFICNHMRHKSFLFQVHRAYESKLHERCEFANAFLGSEYRGLARQLCRERKLHSLNSRNSFVGDLGDIPH
jgi:hypothetical protein